MSTVRQTLLFGVAASAVLGCEDDEILNQLPPPTVQIDVLPQQQASVVDILWVVDNSGTMRDEQEALARNFDRFIGGLTTCQGTGVANDVCDFATRTCLASGAQCNPPDYHIGVITTDLVDNFDSGKLRRVGVCTTAQGASPSQGKYRYCLGTDADCTVDPDDPNSDADNSVCDMGQAVSFVTATTPGAAAAFSRSVRVGTSGSAFERGIQAAARALGRDFDRDRGEFLPAPAENANFIRPEASLFVIFVSDEEDESFGEPSYFYRIFETIKGAGNEGLVSVSAIVGDPDSDGPGPEDEGGCFVEAPNPNDPPIARGDPSSRYVALSMYTRGLSAQFRVCDNQRLQCRAGQRCDEPVPGLPGVCVPEGQCTTDTDCGNFQCSGGVGCISCLSGQCATDRNLFLELLEQNGVFGSICSPNYGAVLGALGFEAAGLSRKFELTKIPDCFDDPVKCCAEGVSDEQCATETTLCVLVNGQPIANDRATGWVYDSGSNAIFFDGEFVPPPRAEVQVKYRDIANGDPTQCNDVLN